ncbi:MAG TPA: cell division protein FtsL [Kofleriaceae bacterium]|nr:cell division protein FtsL [Kofleriaceae bacterium]
MYRIFQRADGEAASVRTVVLALVVAAALATAIGILRVARQHEVLRLGFELSRRSEQLGRLHEERRQLELELATLAAPDRIRKLAVQLGMTPVSPDRIRLVPRHLRAAQAGPPRGADATRSETRSEARERMP